MPLAFDATVGGAGATSYITVAESEDVLVVFPQGAAWNALTNADEEKYLMQATAFLDMQYEWFGRVLNATQRLRWPRTIVYDTDGRIIQAGTIPQQLKVATALLGWEFSQSDLFTELSGDEAGIQRVDAGNILVELNKNAEIDGMLGRRYPVIENLLRSIGRIRDAETRGIFTVNPAGF
jgi:hypothetical protein